MHAIAPIDYNINEALSAFNKWVKDAAENVKKNVKIG